MLVEIDVDKNGELIPPKNDKVALIDADTLIYTTCLYCQEENLILWGDDLDELRKQGCIIDEKKGVFYSIDIEEAFKQAKKKIDEILLKTGCLTYELHFTDNTKSSFRYKIYNEYKANRKKLIPPAGLQKLKELFVERDNALIHSKWEADDFVVFKKTKEPEKYILVAIDKDVLNSVEGKHFSYYESAKYGRKQKWVEIDKDTAKMWPYYQTIIGDVSDNVIGVKNIGEKKAKQFINKNMTEKEMWDGVVKAYESKGLTEKDAILNMNLVNMHLLYEDKGKIKVRKWLPKFNERGEYVF